MFSSFSSKSATFSNQSNHTIVKNSPRLNIVIYLIKKYKTNPRFLGLSIEKSNLEDCIPFLGDEIAWQRYKKTLEIDFQTNEMYLASLMKQKKEIRNLILPLKQEKKFILKKMKTCEELDKFILNNELHSLLLAKDEIKKYFPSYLSLKTIKDKKDYLKAHPSLMSLVHPFLKNLEKPLPDNENTFQEKNDVVNLKAVLQKLELKLRDAKLLNEVSLESSSELTPSQSLGASLECDDVLDISKAPNSEYLKNALLNNVRHGISCFKQALRAYVTTQENQHHKKIILSTLAGFISIVMGVSGLFLLKTSIFSLTASLSIVFIASILTTIFATALYCDSNTLKLTKKQIVDLKKQLIKLEKKMVETQETLLTHFFQSFHKDSDLFRSSTSQAASEFHKKITDLNYRAENNLKNSLDKNISKELNELEYLFHQRDKLINENPKLKSKIKEYFQNDPKLLRERALHYVQAENYDILLKSKSKKIKSILFGLVTISVITFILLGTITALGILL